MSKRQLILNDYKTAEDGLFTLTSCKITKASQVQNFVSVPGRFSPLDLSTILTDGQPYYGNASLDAVLESSEGTREDRQERIDEMVTRLDGYQMQIVHPDHPGQYMIGRVQVMKDYNDLVHCAVRVVATCEPWFYNESETYSFVNLPANEQTANLRNNGKLAVVPTVEVAGTTATLVVGSTTYTLSEGTYQLPELYLLPGNTPIQYSAEGEGLIAFTYREAVLAV